MSLQFLFDAVKLKCPMLGVCQGHEVDWDEWGMEQPPDDDENTEYVWLESPVEFSGRHDGPVITEFASKELKRLVAGYVCLWLDQRVDDLLAVNPTDHDTCDKVEQLLKLRDAAEAWAYPEEPK